MLTSTMRVVFFVVRLLQLMSLPMTTICCLLGRSKSLKNWIALAASHHQQSKVISYAGHMGLGLRTLNKVDLIFEVGCKLLGAGRKITINLH